MLYVLLCFCQKKVSYELITHTTINTCKFCIPCNKIFKVSHSSESLQHHVPVSISSRDFKLDGHNLPYQSKKLVDDELLSINQ